MKKIPASLLFICFYGFLCAQTISLDSTFGVNGVVETDLSNHTDNNVFGVNVNLLPDGKIIAGGGKNQRFTLQRYDKAGLLDTTFLSNPSSLGIHAFGTAIQQDGKIIACAPKRFTPFNMSVIRFESGGAVDSTFGENGIATTSAEAFFASNLFEQSDGKIVVFYAMVPNGEIDSLVVIRLNPNGTLDSSFALNGHVILPFGGALNILLAGMETQDGKLLFAGLSDNQLLLFRLNANGTLDNSFGANGILIDKLIGQAWAFALAVQPDGKIVVAGHQSSLNSAFIVRYHPNGDRDIDFGFEGVEYLQEGYKAVGVAILPNGKILAVIRGLVPSEESVALAILHNNGQRDMAFGESGVFTSGINHMVRNLILSGNEVYVSAQTEQYQVSILRFLLDLNVGTLNPSEPDPTLWVYPNPIAEQFTLEFGLVQQEQVSIYLTDIQGKRVQSFAHNQVFEPGEHALALFCSSHLPSGNYILSLEISGQKMTSVQVTKK